MKKEDRQTVESYVKSGVNRAIKETGEKSGIGSASPGSVITEDSGPVLYSSPSGSAYPSEPILTSKTSGWIGVFGDHYLCELGCKKYANKRLDDVIKFFEREVRLWYKAKELAKKGKLDVAVKSYVRKPRTKKQKTKDENEPSI